jgi:hypothetical protein
MTDTTITRTTEASIVSEAYNAYLDADHRLRWARRAEYMAEATYQASKHTAQDRDRLVAAWAAGDAAKDLRADAWQDYANACLAYPEAAGSLADHA